MKHKKSTGRIEVVLPKRCSSEEKAGGERSELVFDARVSINGLVHLIPAHPSSSDAGCTGCNRHTEAANWAAVTWCVSGSCSSAIGHFSVGVILSFKRGARWRAAHRDCGEGGLTVAWRFRQAQTR